MRKLVPLSLLTLTLAACGGAQPGAPTTPDGETASEPVAQSDGTAPEAGKTESPSDSGNEFVTHDSTTAKGAHGATPSKIKSTATEAAMKFIVLDKKKGPLLGIVVSLTGPDGKKYFTEETDAEGYAEVLVPVGKKYDLVYLSLGQRDIETAVTVTNEPKQNIKLTLRYEGYEQLDAAHGGRIVMKGITFDTAKATIRPESFPELDRVVEYLTHKTKVRIEISGHTDNVGNPKANKTLSEKRAQACRDYLVNKGIDKSRIEAVGYGDERPIDSNATDAGRQKNRRIEATEL